MVVSWQPAVGRPSPPAWSRMLHAKRDCRSGANDGYAMHELPVTEAMLAVALDAASGHHASRITTIDLVIAELGSIVDDSIQFYFDPLSRRHSAEGAVLRFRREPAEVVCWMCGHRSDARVTGASMPSPTPADRAGRSWRCGS